jgi:hypothetical protein
VGVAGFHVLGRRRPNITIPKEAEAKYAKLHYSSELCGKYLPAINELLGTFRNVGF